MPTNLNTQRWNVRSPALLAGVMWIPLLTEPVALAQQPTRADDERRAIANEVINRILNGEADPQAVAGIVAAPMIPAAETLSSGPVGQAPPARVGPRPRSLDLVGVFGAVPFQLDALGPDERPDPTARPMKIGREQEILVSSQNAGSWVNLPDGGRMWTFSAQSPNAEFLRLRIDPFFPPRGAELIVWDAVETSESYGPVTRARARDDMPYWTPTVFGNTMRLEYYLPPEAVGEHHLTITSAALGFPTDDGDGGLAGGGTFGACQQDVTCEPAWAARALSVAHIRFQDGGTFICSGAMVNRLPAFDATPYFWTANHCISTDAVANTVEVYWLYQSTVCSDESTVNAYSTYPRTDGAVVLTNIGAPDYSLLGLTPDDIPGGITWSGWASAAPGNPEAATEIHHPLGQAKSISHGNFEGLDGAEPCAAPIATTFRFDLNNGGQAGGSSGAPVFTDATQQIRAVVSCSETDLCSPAENCWEGSLNAAYGTLAPFMDAASTVYVNIAYGGVESGTLAQPWDEVVEGYFGVPGGGTVIFTAGTYPQYSFTGTKACVITSSGGSTIFE